MKKLLNTIVMRGLILLFISPAGLFAQEWTKAQNEVWKVVEDSWAQWQQGGGEGLTTSFHEKYQGWNADDPLPVGKQEVQKSMDAMMKMMTINYYSLNRARIVVLETTAVVHYYCNVYFTWNQGEKTSEENFKAKFAEFYIKEGGTWKLLGDFTAEMHEDKDE
jgi:hypothetical protein